MMSKKTRIGTEKTEILELEKSLNFSGKKIKRVLKRLEKNFIEINYN